MIENPLNAVFAHSPTALDFYMRKRRLFYGMKLGAIADALSVFAHTEPTSDDLYASWREYSGIDVDEVDERELEKLAVVAAGG